MGEEIVKWREGAFLGRKWKEKRTSLGITWAGIEGKSWATTSDVHSTKDFMKKKKKANEMKSPAGKKLRDVF